MFGQVVQAMFHTTVETVPVTVWWDSRYLLSILDENTGVQKLYHQLHFAQIRKAISGL